MSDETTWDLMDAAIDQMCGILFRQGITDYEIFISDDGQVWYFDFQNEENIEDMMRWSGLSQPTWSKTIVEVTLAKAIETAATMRRKIGPEYNWEEEYALMKKRLRARTRKAKAKSTTA